MVDIECIRNSSWTTIAVVLTTALVAIFLFAIIQASVQVKYRNVEVSSRSSRSGRLRRRNVQLLLLVLLLGGTMTAFSYSRASEKSIQSLLSLYDQGRSSRECGHLGPMGNVVIKGIGLRVEGFIQCRHKGASRLTPLHYRFRLPSAIQGSRISGVDGVFFIDEAGKAHHPGTEVVWSVLYGDDLLCEVKVEWGETGRCQMQGEVPMQQGQRIEIRERVVNPRPGQLLFAGIYKPALALVKPC